MRVSKEAKAASNVKIVDVASRLFRQRGIEDTAVGDVMKEAGLTHGGFYRHFKSKDELASAAIAKAFNDVIDMLEHGLREYGAKHTLANYIDQYLSMQHVENPGYGCPIAALSSEAARSSASFRQAIADSSQRMMEVLSRIILNEAAGRSGIQRDKNHTKAIGLMNVLVGSVVQARLAGSELLAREILETGQQLARRWLSD